MIVGSATLTLDATGWPQQDFEVWHMRRRGGEVERRKLIILLVDSRLQKKQAMEWS